MTQLHTCSAEQWLRARGVQMHAHTVTVMPLRRKARSPSEDVQVHFTVWSHTQVPIKHVGLSCWQVAPGSVDHFKLKASCRQMCPDVMPDLHTTFCIGGSSAVMMCHQACGQHTRRSAGCCTSSLKMVIELV